jgi:hypothetical protein
MLIVGHQEVMQYKEEWGLVMQKLENVGSVLVDVGDMCQKHDLKEEELPTNIRTVLGSLQRCVLCLTERLHVLILTKGT